MKYKYKIYNEPQKIKKKAIITENLVKDSNSQFKMLTGT